jgi:hypothetical protein
MRRRSGLIVGAHRAESLESRCLLSSSGPTDFTNIANYEVAPSIDTDAGGNVYAVYQGGPSGSWHTFFTSKSAGAGGSWSAPLDLGGSNIAKPRIDVDANGAVYVVWHDNNEIWYRNRPAGSSTWSSALRLSTAAAGRSLEADVAADGSGNVNVVWHDEVNDANNGSDDWDIHYRRFEAGTWGAETTISNSTGDDVYPNLATGPDGSVHVVWHNFGDDKAYYRQRSAAGLWGAIERVDTNIQSNARTGAPAIVVGPDNAAYVAWHNDDGASYWQIGYRKRAANGTWGSAVFFGDTATDVADVYPSIGLDPRTGTVSIGWVNYSNYSIIQGRANGTFFASRTLSGNYGAKDNSLAVDPTTGRVYSVFQGNKNGTNGGSWDLWFYTEAGPTADVVDVTPDPRNTPVASVNITFSEAASGVDLSDLKLTKDGNPTNLLTGSSATLSTSDGGVTWTLGNIGALTQFAGTYTLAFTAAPSGVTNSVGDPVQNDASDTWVNTANNTAPTIGSLSDSPDPVAYSGTLTLTANAVNDAEGNPVTVTFYRESNNTAGLQTGAGGDTQVGTSSSSPFSVQVTPPPPNITYTYYAQAADSGLLTSNVVSTTNSVINTAPMIASLSDSPDPVNSSSTLTLTANGVSDPENDPLTVNFYRETNSVAGFQLGADTLVGSDTTAPYSIGIAPGSPGSYTYYAQVTDFGNLKSGVVSTTNTVLIYSATPGTPNLNSASDTGSSASDDLTKLDNSSAGTTLKFTVGGTIVGATVTLYADDVSPIGSFVATSTISTVTTNGTFDLSDGTHSITARVTEPGKSESLPSNALSVTVDTAAPVADVVDVSPDPRNSSVASLTINFDGPVSGFDFFDMSLKRDGGTNLLVNPTNAPTTSNNTVFTVPALASITNSPGTYVFTVNATNSFIVDAAGNSIAADGSDAWTFLPAWLSPTSVATWNQATKVLNVTGAATVIADPGSDNPVVSVDGIGSNLTIAPPTDMAVHFAALNMTNSALASLSSLGGARTASHHRVLVVGSGSFTIDTTSTLGLADNDLIVDYSGASPAGAIEAMVRAGFNEGDWLGDRITSSVAGDPATNGNFHLGVAENGSLVNPFGNGASGPLFDGQSVDNTTVLVKFTHRVDLDLDGMVTGNDAAVFNGAYSEGDSGATWMSGDVDMDGIYSSNDAAFFNSFYDESLGAI